MKNLATSFEGTYWEGESIEELYNFKEDIHDKSTNQLLVEVGNT
jgi:hypothetical protein